MVFLFLFYPALWLRTNYIQQFLIVHERIKEAILLQLLERLFWLIYIVASVLEVDKITTFVIPILLGLLVHGLLGTKLIMNKKENSEEGFNDTENTDNKFSNLKNFGLISVISNVGNLDGAVVATVSTLAESGNYNLAVRFRNPIQLSFQVFSARLRPVAARKNKIEIATLFRSNLTFLVFGILGIIVLSAFAYEGAIVLFGDSFVGLNMVLSMGLLCSIPNGICVICGSFLTSVGFEDFMAKATLYYVFASLSGIAIAAYLFGSFGAIFSSLITGILLSMILVKKSLKEFFMLT
jgi:O-antigen/teichoic acid export membrane protein